MKPQLHRLVAFTEDPAGGNPAGVWLGATLPDAAEMQRIASEVGFSETAFLAPLGGADWQVRYFSPEVEVPFCGHATIASGVQLGCEHGDGVYRFQTQAGEVPVRVRTEADGLRLATLTSVEPEQRPFPDGLLDQALERLRWYRADIDWELPPALAYAGAWHLVLAVRDRRVLAGLDYDFEGLKSLMQEHGLTTLQLLWQEDEHTFLARNPFPVGGVVEDPATGAAAAALGGYLRAAGLVEPPDEINVYQGDYMGRPSKIVVGIPKEGGIEVTGTAVEMGAAGSG